MALKPRLAAKRLIKRAAGWGFVALGLVGLVLPILQGFLFLGVGLYLLADDSPWVQRKIEALRRRFPRYAETFDESQARARDWMAHHANRVRDNFRNNRR